MSSATSLLWKTFRADRDHRSGHLDHPSGDHPATDRDHPGICDRHQSGIV